jgi:glycosyltransferase involved in cell wall biosynthesis
MEWNGMGFWLVSLYERIPTVDGEVRPLRCGNLAKAMESRGHEVVLWTPRFDHIGKVQRDAPAEKNPSGWTSPTIKLLAAPGYRRSISFARWRHNRTIARSFRSGAASEMVQPNLVFVSLPAPELAAEAVGVCRALDIPVVVDVRDRWPDLYLTILPKLLWPAGRLVLKREFDRVRGTLSGASGITAISREYLRWALQLAGRDQGRRDGVFPLGYQGGDELEGISAGVSAEALTERYGIDHNSLVVTFVGAFGASYDLDTVISAARRLAREREQSTQFLLVGAGDSKERIRKRAERLPNVMFTGWVSHPVVAGLLRLSTVGLAAFARHATQSLPNKLFEYAAAGLPSV